jgi:hypothetical protein
VDELTEAVELGATLGVEFILVIVGNTGSEVLDLVLERLAA